MRGRVFGQLVEAAKCEIVFSFYCKSFELHEDRTTGQVIF